MGSGIGPPDTTFLLLSLWKFQEESSSLGALIWKRLTVLQHIWLSGICGLTIA